MSKQLSERARGFLHERRFAILATLNADGTAQQSTMWYLLEEDGTITMNTKVGRIKERNLRRDTRISLCIEDEQNYLTLRGRGELIDDATQSQRDIYRLACRYDGEESADQAMSHFSQEQRVTIRFTIERTVERFV